MAKRSSIYGSALRALGSAPRIVFVLALVLLVFDLLLYVGNRFRPLSLSSGLAIVASMTALRALIRAWLRPGYLRAISATQTGDELKPDRAIPPLGAFLGALVVNTLCGLIELASIVAGAVPGIALVLVFAHYNQTTLVKASLAVVGIGVVTSYFYGWLAVRFGEYALALEGYGAHRALSRAWNLARGHRLELLRVQLFASAVELAGILVGAASLGIGMIFTVPATRIVADHATIAMYRKLVADAAASADVDNADALARSGMRPSRAPRSAGRRAA